MPRKKVGAARKQQEKKAAAAATECAELTEEEAQTSDETTDLAEKDVEDSEDILEGVVGEDDTETGGTDDELLEGDGGDDDEDMTDADDLLAGEGDSNEPMEEKEEETNGEEQQKGVQGNQEQQKSVDGQKEQQESVEGDGEQQKSVEGEETAEEGGEKETEKDDKTAKTNSEAEAKKDSTENKRSPPENVVGFLQEIAEFKKLCRVYCYPVSYDDLAIPEFKEVLMSSTAGFRFSYIWDSVNESECSFCEFQAVDPVDAQGLKDKLQGICVGPNRDIPLIVDNDQSSSDTGHSKVRSTLFKNKIDVFTCGNYKPKYMIDKIGFVKGIPDTTTTDKLLEAFAGASKVFLPTESNGDLRGYAYVQFESSEAKAKCMFAKQKNMVDGVEVSVNSLKRYNQIFNTPSKTQSQGPQRPQYQPSVSQPKKRPFSTSAATHVGAKRNRTNSSGGGQHASNMGSPRGQIQNRQQASGRFQNASQGRNSGRNQGMGRMQAGGMQQFPYQDPRMERFSGQQRNFPNLMSSPAQSLNARAQQGLSAPAAMELLDTLNQLVNRSARGYGQSNFNSPQSLLGASNTGMGFRGAGQNYNDFGNAGGFGGRGRMNQGWQQGAAFDEWGQSYSGRSGGGSGGSYAGMGNQQKGNRNRGKRGGRTNYR